MNSFETLCNDNIDALQIGSFSSPVSTGSTSVFESCEYNLLVPLFFVLSGGIENGHLFASWEMKSIGSHFFNQLVNQPGVSEGAPCHNLVVSSPGAVGVEVLGFHSLGDQESGRRGVFGDGPSRRDVIRCDRVTHVQQAVSVSYVFYLRKLCFQRLEERGVVDVGRFWVPLVLFGFWNFQSIPSVSSFRDLFVDFLELVFVHEFSAEFLGGVPRGPDVS